MTAALSFRNAIRDALAEELERDESVFLIGEDVQPGGVFNVTPDLHARFPKRVIDTPISELAFTGAAFGAAVRGLRPVVEIMFADFLGLVLDTLVNQAAKYWYLSGEQASVPLVVRSAVGGGGRLGACHSQTPAGWFLGEPGLKLVAPSNAADAKGLLKAAIRDDNPVVYFEHKMLYGLKSDVPEGDTVVPIGKAAVIREGADVTLVAAMAMVAVASRAAEQLAGEGIDAEVIDLRTLQAARRRGGRGVPCEDQATRRRRRGTADGRVRRGRACASPPRVSTASARAASAHRTSRFRLPGRSRTGGVRTSTKSSRRR